MNLNEKKLVIFDLDGTLAPSKQPMKPNMAKLFSLLVQRIQVAVISGGGFVQFQTQFLTSLPPGMKGFTNLYLLPTSGTKMLIWQGSWVEKYSEALTKQEKDNITAIFNEALKLGGYVRPDKMYGQMIEDRISQVTFSALGQDAPLQLKLAWDPTREKRQRIVGIMKEKLPNFDIRIGGTTSIDVTHRGVNKAYGIHKLEHFMKLPIYNMLFVGDSLFYGGNDYPVKATGIDCVEVTGPEETEKVIAGWLGIHS